MSKPTLRQLPSFARSDATALLARASDLLDQVLAQSPIGQLPTDLRVRIRALLDDVHAGEPRDPSDAATEPKKPRILVLKLAPAERFVLESALSSEHLASTFGSVHDLLLAAGRGGHYSPVPALTTQVPADYIASAIVFADAELVGLRGIAAGFSIPFEDYLKGCAFAYVRELRNRFPDDAQLNPRPLVTVVKFSGGRPE